MARTTTAQPPAVDSPAAWAQAFAAALSMFTVFGVGYSFGAFFESITTEFGSGSGATATVFGITISLSFIAGSYTGALADRVGPKPVALLGGISLVAGLLLTTVVPSIWLAYIFFGLGVGFAIACGYVPMVAVVGGWFVEKRAVALGAAVAGIGLGTLVANPVAAAIIAATSWRWAFVIFAAFAAVSMTAVAVLIRPGPVAEPAAQRQPFGELWPNDDFRVLYLSMIATSFGLFIPFVFIASFAEAQGHGSFPSAVLVGLIGGASVVGRLLIGGIADRLGAASVFRATFVVMAVGHLLWLVGGSSYVLLVLFALVFGTAYGGFIALSPAVAAQRFGLKGLGGILGTWYTAAAFGALLGPPIAGWLIDTVDYWAAITFAFAATAIGTATLRSLE